MNSAPTITVFGTGALAMLFGARLAHHGARVCLVGTWREGLEVMARRGIEVEEDGRTWRQAVESVELSDAAGLERAEFALVVVKSHQTRAVAASAAAAGETVLTLQNGLGNLEILERAAGAERVAQGLSSRGATVLGPGRVRDAGGGPIVLDRGRRELAALWTAAGIPVRRTHDLRRAVWEKLAVNCAINPVTALYGVENGAIVARPELARLAAGAATETAAVGRALAVPLGDDLPDQALAVARRTAGNRSSMLQDLDRGATTEIEAICGAVVREGGRAGVETPINRELLERVRRRQGTAETAPRRPVEVSA